MRLQRLHIPAFGPFTGLEVSFPDQPNDFHVVYGANEAGKSSLLRAIRDCLFGIPGQSTDNFLHAYHDLRIKAEIWNRAGTRLSFQRRKGNKNTLLKEDGTQLPDNALTPFLGTVDRAYFSAMFGLGMRELHEGAQELLRGEGSMGSALFSASLGGTPVQKILEALQQEADGLFRGNARVNVSIRPAATRYKDLLRQSRDAMVSPETWDKVENELSEAETAKGLLEAEIAQLDTELQWISRCEDALPTVGRLHEEEKKLALLPALPDLASDFTRRAQEARQALSDAQGEVQRLTTHLHKLQAQLRDSPTSPAVLAVATELDQLHQDLGVYRAHKKSLADLQIKLAGLDPHLRAGMQNLQLTGAFDALESHRLSSPVRLACEEVAETLTDASTKHADNARRIEELELQIQVKESQLLALPESDLTGIRDALAVAAEATEADRTISNCEEEVRLLTRETADRHRQVQGAPLDLEATERMVVPANATIRRYHERFETIRREIKSEQDKILKLEERAGSIQAELVRLQRQGDLPSEEALRHARDHRDHGWSLVLAEWKGHGTQEVLVPGCPLEVAFPQTIAKADLIADQLRLDAEAVAQAEEKRSQLCEISAQKLAGQNRILEFQAALDACEKAWQAEWSVCGLIPRSPLEMEEWREQWSGFCDRLAKLRAAEETLQRKRGQIQAAKQSLALVLDRDEATEFRVLFNAAKELVQRGEKTSGRREEVAGQFNSLKSDLAKLETSRDRLNKAVHDATEKWKAQCAAVGLPADTSPAAGVKLLRERKDLLAKFEEWQDVSREFQAKSQAVAQYEHAVCEQAKTFGFQGDTTEARESALWQALTEAVRAQERHVQLAAQNKETSIQLANALGLVTQTEQTLHGLLKLAGLATAAELEPLLAHLEQRATVQVQIDDLRKTLTGLARGQAVDTFVARVRAEDPDTFAARQSTAAQAKAAKEAALHAIRERLFRLGDEQRTLERAGDAAADFRQQAESCAAALRKDAARFLRLRLAICHLEAQIEQFRKDNQGPLLQKSGEVFQAITRDAFSGLSAEFIADDVPVLVGVRPDQTKVPVEGLSDGSRDQLYLSLRLAALVRYLEEHEPMPLILDDLLITFDNERTKAILPQLASLAQSTQIFLFTHHEHLVELCHQTLGQDRFHLHRL